MIYKNKDIETNINNKTVDIGNVGVRFYTEDENTGSIRIYIKWNGQPVNLDTINMRPKLDLFLSDGSIFIDEPINVVLAQSGLIQYNIPNKVIKHAGIVNAKLFLESEIESVHVANFSFNIVDSGVEDKVQKEVSLNLVEDTVRRIMSDDLTVLLDSGFKTELTTDLQNYISENSEQFKGPQGERGLQGEQGIQGERGEQGLKGDTGEQGIQGEMGPAGPTGPMGPKGDKGNTGEKGEKGNSSVNQTRLPQILRKQYFENLEIPVVDSDNGIIEQINPLNAQTVNYYFIGNVLDINEPETKTTDFPQFQQGIVTMSWTDSSVSLSNSSIQNYINTTNTAFALLHIYNGKPVLDKAYISPSMREDYMNDLIKTFGNRNDFEIKLGKGIIFDISRRFTNLATLKTIVDEISANKGDYLQLHFSDDQGYSIHSEILGQNGTTSNDKYLTKKEIMELIDYANGKNVMIVPDFDVPSHSQGWLDLLKVNNPDLYSNVVSDYDVSLANYYGNDIAAKFIESLIEEITTMFYQPKYGDRLVFSIGADEVPGVDDAQIDYVNFVNRMAKKVYERGYHPRVWNDCFTDDGIEILNDNIEVVYWQQGLSSAEKFIEENKMIVNSNYYILTYGPSSNGKAEGVIDEQTDYIRSTFANNKFCEEENPYTVVNTKDNLKGTAFTFWNEDATELTDEELLDQVIPIIKEYLTLV
ncbi:family 20 glycosylhydrolase [Staphylococcus ureilyticus]|uniref:family 20 glycosylhydrolase n=1 Tax=Staphylococcus ureilyticus TaxID=94138 RepID=UPI00321915FA